MDSLFASSMARKFFNAINPFIRSAGFVLDADV